MELCQIFVFVLIATVAMTSGQTCKDIPNPISCNVIQEKDGETKPCRFPFRMAGRIFYGCTTFLDPDDKPWCSTATNGTHHHIKGGANFGYCKEETCPTDLDGFDRIDNINALKTEQLMEKSQCEEENTHGIDVKDCKCVDYRSCPSIRKIVRQSKQLGHHKVIREKLLAYYRERVCTEREEEGLVHCCPLGRKDPPPPPPVIEADGVPKPTRFIDPRSITVNQDSGKWLPSGDRKECGISTVESSVFSRRIFGGKECKMGDCPFMALIGYERHDGKLFYGCGGSLINKRYVLTAAHCLPPITPDIAEIVLGEHDTTENPDCNEIDCVAEKVTRKPEKVIVHPGYDGRPDSQYDIALIRLDENVELFSGDSKASTITPICLPFKESDFVYKLKPDDQFKVMGWGKTEDSAGYGPGGSATDTVLEVDVPFFKSAKCKTYFRRMNIANQICAGGTEGEDSCQGDSGGPLVARQGSDGAFYQVGVVSYGTADCAIGIPAVYTSVSHFLPWIFNNLEE